MSEKFKTIFSQAIKLLKEAAPMQNSAPQAAPAMPPGPELAAPQQPQTPTPAPQGQGGVAQQSITVDAIIDRLNVIRGGKSFNDAEVYGQLTTMFKNTSEQDKAVLDKLLSQIEQIAQSTLPQPQRQPEPAAQPPQQAALQPPMQSNVAPPAPQQAPMEE